LIVFDEECDVRRLVESVCSKATSTADNAFGKRRSAYLCAISRIGAFLVQDDD